MMHPSTSSGRHTAKRRIPRVLSIAGTDPTGGAGIQADLKSIAASGGYGMAVVTALVAQNTTGVRSVHRPPVEFLREQLYAVSDDVVIDAVKIGMLFDDRTAGVVRDWIEDVRPPHVVLDPVMVAASGDGLVDGDAEDAIRDTVACADLVTPNVPELAALVDEPVATSWSAIVEQANRLAHRYEVYVLAKGGHVTSDVARDALVGPEGTLYEFVADRVDTRHTHGTGCSLSAAVATHRSRLGSWEPAVDRAKRWLTESIEAGADLEVGRGRGPVSHLAALWRMAGTHSPGSLSVP